MVDVVCMGLHRFTTSLLKANSYRLDGEFVTCESLGFHTETILPFSERGLPKQIQPKAKNNQYLSFTNGLVGGGLFSGLGLCQTDSVPFPLIEQVHHVLCVPSTLSPLWFASLWTDNAALQSVYLHFIICCGLVPGAGMGGPGQVFNITGKSDLKNSDKMSW